MKNKFKKNRGFTIFFAMLISSLALAVGLAIFDLTIRELDLSATAAQSQYAIYAADTGADCALYWDYKCPISGGPTYCTRSGGSAFATSSASGQPPSGSNLLCNGLDISTTWITNNPPPTSSSATTTFTIQIAAPPLQTYCATVTVGKYTNGSGVLFTSVTSHGYNTCATGEVTRVERAFQVNY